MHRAPRGGCRGQGAVQEVLRAVLKESQARNTRGLDEPQKTLGIRCPHEGEAEGQKGSNSSWNRSTQETNYM